MKLWQEVYEVSEFADQDRIIKDMTFS